MLTSLATIPTPDVATFARVLVSLPSGARPVLQYFTLTDRHRKKNAVLRLDHSWYRLLAICSLAARTTKRTQAHYQLMTLIQDA